jgi:hypothetical protein
MVSLSPNINVGDGDGDGRRPQPKSLSLYVQQFVTQTETGLKDKLAVYIVGHTGGKNPLAIKSITATIILKWISKFWFRLRFRSRCLQMW